MKVKINGEEYQVLEYMILENTKKLQSFLESEYEKLDSKYRLIAKPIAREILRRMEDNARKKVSEEEAMKYRPARTIDACLYLIGIMSIILQEALKYVEVECSTTANTVTDIKAKIERKG